EYFERAVELAPNYPQAMMALVAVMTDLGRPEEARAWYEELSERAPDSAEAQQAAGFVEAG
ncbi:MAG: tetratricopeptide repeat protein, partial [Acidobacteriota bacterium]